MKHQIRVGQVFEREYLLYADDIDMIVRTLPALKEAILALKISSLLRSPNNSRDLYLSRNYRVTLVAVQLDLNQKDSTAPNEFREFFSYPMLFLGITGRNTVHELVSNRPSILCLDLEVEAEEQ
ncbi:hypothetical protein TNIN_355861 [Trichonephila inaurata madagascariensis]|uniref:Uncharacterized protein n=1 Tax=Trichonephila inaurata madagascariensis TaxID=2747483 RepID=A0A8X7BU98_9ARAC|nr:hypothetical protein TNIN_355861 [Trichonephila inaurata madagascariensis]